MFICQTTTFNPKNRFAVDPSSAATSPEAPNHQDNSRNSNRFAYGSPEKPQQPHSSTAAPSSSHGKVSPHDADENSIDNLLNLMGSPSQPQLATTPSKAPANNGSAFTYNNQASTITSPLNSQFFLESTKIGMNGNAGHSGKFPSMNNMHDHSAYTTTNTNTADTSTYNTTKYITADSNISSPFDSPSSHGSAQKSLQTNQNTSNFAHSVSMFNMSANNSSHPLMSPSYLANSFDSVESSDNNNSNSNNKVPSIYNAMNGSPAATGKSGSGVNGTLFGGAHANHSNTHTNDSALFPKGSTATFTSQNAAFKAHSEPKNESKPSHFLPTSINATTVVSNASAAINSSSSSSSSSSNGAKQK